MLICVSVDRDFIKEFLTYIQVEKGLARHTSTATNAISIVCKPGPSRNGNRSQN